MIEVMITNDMPFASLIVNKTSFCLILVLLLPTGS